MDGRQHQSDSQPVAASDVERIVREVLGRLSSGLSQKGGVFAPTQTAANTVAINDRVVTARLLADRLAGKAAVCLVRGAVVTPAARDLLRESNVEVRYVDSVVAGSRGSRLVLGVAESTYDPAPLVAALKRGAIAVEQIARVGLLGVIDGLAERIGLDGERAMLLTGEPEAAVCLANRERGVRAVACGCAASTRRARSRIAANLLVVHPRGKSVHELSKMASELCSTSGECPPAYAERLS